MRIQTFAIVTLVLAVGTAAEGQDLGAIVNTIRGATVVAQDSGNTFLGTITNAYAADSIFNEFGPHGGKFGAESIWNEYGTFGSKYSGFSPFNPYSSNPPMVIKNGRVVAYLTTNKTVRGGLNPNLLKAVADQF